MDRAEARYGCPRETRRGQGGRHPPTRSRASEAAYLEAASVRAFDWLEDELSAHGAPERLQARARRAARDEVRHARVIRSFAERAGARVPSLRVKAARARSLEAMAVENAVEGCVNETLGAAFALHQARRARERGFRATMRRVADDEVRHAELAWAVARWVEGQLSPAARDRVRRAKARAVERALRSACRPTHIAVVTQLGVPTPREARAIALALARTLWA
jgi:hypothetical protein